ncbi:hypothetical protein HHK36_011027 [Tetracentron sinense]|uniref:Ubiquitin fusion degradaton protein n=1 Tax=Tetracentron sinense TaxID=13715 RepID=A0A835DK34_TETSI|nr:hypothetical protein HHK36_011027 [Tetracentron sinense]
MEISQPCNHVDLESVMLNFCDGLVGYRRMPSSFEQAYRCYPVSVINKLHLDKGDKIVMPPSALNRLASLRIDYPMLFQLYNPSSGRVSHCGVLEFTADEGLVFLPSWMMENMCLQEGDIMQVSNATLSKGNYVKLQPHTKDFLDISDPKAMLLGDNNAKLLLFNTLCSFAACDTIMVTYNSNKYYIDILETKPSFGVSIIETDCEVDFAPPLDYKEPEKPAPSSVPNNAPAEVQEELAKEEPKFSPFTEAVNGTNQSTSASVTARRRSGKLVFGGSNAGQAPIATPKDAAKATSPETPKKEEPKFQAFTGKKHSLRN